MIWRTLFPLSILFVLVDGFISNLLYPSRLPLVYKDIFFLVVYLFFLIQGNAKGWLVEFLDKIGNKARLLASIFVFIAMLQVFNPYLPGLVVGLLGFKILFMYWPLAIIAYAYIDDFQRVKDLFATIVVFSILINAFALYQFIKGPEFILSTFGPGFQRAVMVAQLDYRVQVESFLRVLGTFASSGQYANFLIVNTMLSFALFFMSRSQAEQTFWGFCNGLNFICLLATGSRGALIGLFLTLGCFGLISRKGRPIIAMAIVAALSISLGFYTLGRGVVERYKTLRSVEMVRSRGLETTALMFVSMLDKYPLGKGLGVASTASQHLISAKSLNVIELAENYPSKLLLETGIAGVIVFYLFLIMLISKWYKAWLPMTSVDTQMHDVAMVIAAYCFTQLTIIQLTGGMDTPPAAIFIWLLVGIGAKLATFCEPATEVEGEDA